MPERWLVLTVRVPSEESYDDLTEGLITLGGAAVVEEDEDSLTTYVAAPANPERFILDARERLAALVPGGAAELQWRWEEDQDWASKWKEGLAPRKVGLHFVVAPPWAVPEIGGDDMLIVIEPSMAFGTGEHETTRGTLRLLETTVRHGDVVLDVGAGSGILAIAAARLGAGHVVAVEHDDDALACCRENLERNGVAEIVRAEHATVDQAYLDALAAGSFDVVAANVLSSILEPVVGALAARLAPGGRLVLGGMLEDEVERMVMAAANAGLTLDAEDREGVWWSGRFSSSERRARPAP